MHAGGPALAQFFFHGTSGKIQPRLVYENGLPARIHNEDVHRRRISHVPEPLLAFAERVLALLQLDAVSFLPLEGGV